MKSFVTTNDVAPSTTEHFHGFGGIIVDSTRNICFIGLSGLESELVSGTYLHDGSEDTNTKIVDTNTLIPGGESTTFSDIGEFSMDENGNRYLLALTGPEPSEIPE